MSAERGVPEVDDGEIFPEVSAMYSFIRTRSPSSLGSRLTSGLHASKPLSTDFFYNYDRSLRAIRSRVYKLIRGSDGSRELYYVAEDPDEQRNIADDNPELESKLDDWLASFEHAASEGSVSMSQSTKDPLEDLGYLQ